MPWTKGFRRALWETNFLKKEDGSVSSPHSLAILATRSRDLWKIMSLCNRIAARSVVQIMAILKILLSKLIRMRDARVVALSLVLVPLWARADTLTTYETFNSLNFSIKDTSRSFSRTSPAGAATLFVSTYNCTIASSNNGQVTVTVPNATTSGIAAFELEFASPADLRSFDYLRLDLTHDRPTHHPLTLIWFVMADGIVMERRHTMDAPIPADRKKFPFYDMTGRNNGPWRDVNQVKKVIVQFEMYTAKQITFRALEFGKVRDIVPLKHVVKRLPDGRYQMETDRPVTTAEVIARQTSSDLEDWYQFSVTRGTDAVYTTILQTSVPQTFYRFRYGNFVEQP
jgi:hypothetical protein